MSSMAALGGLFLWSFLAATIVPIGSEPALIAIVLSQGGLIVPVAVATAGNVLGALTTWWIGRGLASVIETRVPGRWEERATRTFDRFGRPALLLSWVPFLGDAIVLVSGFARVPLLPFTGWVTVGKLLRYLLVAWTALRVGGVA
ncbi:MAG TPA: YqaA family protein [Thermoanaerobaculia bacterium]|nr:YqaA family protein [Thermoanaerobaculia bacterium]